MHELSIAVALVERACEKVAELGEARVEALHLKIGRLSGVVPDALLFSWDVATQGTALEGSKLCIVEVPLAIRCDRCDAEREPPDALLLCPVCGEPAFDVVRGRELELVALEVEEHAADAAHR